MNALLVGIGLWIVYGAFSLLHCPHEWILRKGNGRVYAECLRCLKTSGGWRVK